MEAVHEKQEFFVVVVDVLVIFISVKKNLQPQRFGGDGGGGGSALTANSCLSLSLGIDQIRRQQQHLLLSVSLWTLMGKKMTKF